MQPNVDSMQHISILYETNTNNIVNNFSLPWTPFHVQKRQVGVLNCTIPKV